MAKNPRDQQRRATRERILRERETAIEELRQLDRSRESDPTAPRSGVSESVLDEGDEAQACERQDMSFARRARLAERITRLSAALERLDCGEYGTCEVCGREIDPARLAAVPEATTCRQCQEEREQRGEAA